MPEQTDHQAISQRLLWSCDAHAVLSGLQGGPLQHWQGRSLLDRTVVEDETRDLAQAFAAQMTFSMIPCTSIGPDKVPRTVRLSGLPQHDGVGRFTGYRGFAIVSGHIPQDQNPEGMRATDVASAENKTMRTQSSSPPSIGDLTDREQKAFHEIGRLLAEDVMPKIFNDQRSGETHYDEPQHSDADQRVVSLFGDDNGQSEQIDDPILEALSASVQALQAKSQAITPDTRSERKPSDLFSIPGDVQALLDRLPVGVLVSRGDVPIVMNKMILQSLGYDSADDFHDAGAIHDLFAQQSLGFSDERQEPSTLLNLQTRAGDMVPMRVMFQTLPWGYLPASMMVFVPADLVKAPDDHSVPQDKLDVSMPAVRDPQEREEQEAHHHRLKELEAILDTATDGVIVIDGEGAVLSVNSSAQALFGYDALELTGLSFLKLFADESLLVVRDYLEGVRENGVRSLMNDGREVIGLEKQGGRMPLFMTLGRTSILGSGRFCAVLRDLTAWKKVESDLKESRRQAELANAQKSDTLARISHELRTPLSAIMGFAEVMVEERFGPVGNERYRDYLRDIHQSGQHLLSLVNDLLDLAKIEAGKFDLDFEAVDANATVRAALAMIRPEAERHHVFLRSALTSSLPMVVADERTMRQVVINLLSNAVKFTEPGGQVIVTTTLSDEGEVAVRIRDTGVGMDSDDLKMALELFRQTAAGRKAGGTGLGLPLTKALAEANRARFSIKSERGRGTLVEIIFPSNRVLVT
jgi:PAS domain S-box-containing protein